MPRKPKEFAGLTVAQIKEQIQAEFGDCLVINWKNKKRDQLIKYWKKLQNNKKKLAEAEKENIPPIIPQEEQRDETVTATVAQDGECECKMSFSCPKCSNPDQ
jgi:hypothetical protein